MRQHEILIIAVSRDFLEFRNHEVADTLQVDGDKDLLDAAGEVMEKFRAWVIEAGLEKYAPCSGAHEMEEHCECWYFDPYKERLARLSWYDVPDRFWPDEARLREGQSDD